MPRAARRSRRAGGRARPLLAAGVLLGAFWAAGGVVLQMRADDAATAECTALVLDRDTGQTYAGPCVAPRLPATLTALRPGSLPETVAAAR